MAFMSEEGKQATAKRVTFMSEEGKQATAKRMAWKENNLGKRRM
jgi:hypothetical protein